MLKQRKAKNIRQKFANESDTEEPVINEENNKEEQEYFVKRAKRTASTFGRKWSNKKTSVAPSHGAKIETNKALLIEQSKKELEDEWFQQDVKQLANVSSLVNQTFIQGNQPKPEYSVETMEELKRQTFGWKREEQASNLPQEVQSSEGVNKETIPDSLLGPQQIEEEDMDIEEIESESETRWELDQLRRASGNNKYTRKLEKLSNRKLESFETCEILQEPVVVLEKVTKDLECAMKTNDEEMSKVLQEQTERERALDSCRRLLKEKETQVMEASEKYSFYDELGRYFDDLLDMLNEKWTQLGSLRDWEDKLYEEYECNNTLQGISSLAENDLRLAKNEEELENMLLNPSQVNDCESLTCKSGIQKQLANITEERNALFQDVESDYADVSQVVAHFVWWRKNYSKDYEEAYGELMLSKLITEYTKIELLGCWPFELQSLRNVQSIQALDFYHREFGETLSRSSCLISILEGAIIPIISKWIRQLYSYQSGNETRTMSIFCKEILEWSKDSEYLTVVYEKMNEIFLQKAKDILFQLTDNPSWKSDQQEWNAYIYLLRMISYWRTLIPFEKTLEQFTLDEVITRHILPKVRILPNEDILDHLYFILCNCLPQEWPDPYSPYWLAIRALLTRLISTMKKTDKQYELLEACKKRCGYYQ